MSNANDEIATALAAAFDEYIPWYALVMQLPEDQKKLRSNWLLKNQK